MRHRLVRAFSAPSGQLRAPAGRRARRLGAGLLPCCLALGLGLGLVAAGGSPARAAAGSPATGVAGKNPYPTGDVTFLGHGYGPALGMGQWGAFGYAAQYHRTYSWILDHFYGKTTIAHVRNPMISVAIIENLGDPVVLWSPSPWRFGGVAIPARHAARAVLDSSSGRWAVSEASSCTATSGWKRVASNLVDPHAYPRSLLPNAPSSQLLTICRGDGVQMVVRGVIDAYDHLGGMRTLDLLPLEEYVADVTPSESSAGWAQFGSAGPQHQRWGFQSLEAQAVAARTYLLADAAAGGWYGYADICDTGCQSYPGIANESPLATLATADTAGQILETSPGTAAPTQYSSSTGGYTVNDSTWAGTSPFPPVPDAGDAVCIPGGWTCNTLHSWTVSLPVRTIESMFPSIGALQGVRVVARYGSPGSAFGGRARTIEVEGSKGDVSLAGWQWVDDFGGFWSDWFALTDGPGATASPPARRALPAMGSKGEASLFSPTGPLPVAEAPVALRRIARAGDYPARVGG